MRLKGLIMVSLLLPLVFSCGRSVDGIYSNVTLNAACEGLELVSIRVDNSLKGNFFRNLNTGEEYSYPLFVNSKIISDGCGADDRRHSLR